MLVYFHGFGSKGGGPKYEMLKERLSQYTEIFSPDLPINPMEVGDVVRKILKEPSLEYIANFLSNNNPKTIYPMVFVGSSLGGFYASYFARIWGANAVLINPAITPSEGLRRKVGLINAFDGTTFEWKDEYCDYLEYMEDHINPIITSDPEDNASISLFVTLDDDVCPAMESLGHYKYAGWKHIFKDGGHRQMDHFPEVVEYIYDKFYSTGKTKNVFHE